MKRQIAERDGWICHLCTGSVSPHLWGHHSNPDAPVIDHVIPVARGGDDTFENVRLAHRVCNARKGAKVDAETIANFKRKGSTSNSKAA